MCMYCTTLFLELTEVKVPKLRIIFTNTIAAAYNSCLHGTMVREAMESLSLCVQSQVCLCHFDIVTLLELFITNVHVFIMPVWPVSMPKNYDL